MPFQVGHQLWRKGLETRKEQANRTAELLGALVDMGSEKYGDKMMILADGEEISKPEEQFMDRLERLIEYRAPKLARQEHTGANGAPLSLSVVHYGAALPNIEPKAQLNDVIEAQEVKPTIEPTIEIKELKTNPIEPLPTVNTPINNNIDKIMQDF